MELSRTRESMRRLRRSCKKSKLFSQDSDREKKESPQQGSKVKEEAEKDAEEVKEEIEEALEEPKDESKKGRQMATAAESRKQEARKPKPIDGHQVSSIVCNAC